MLTRLDTFSAANEDNKNICWRRGAVPWSLTKSFGLPLHRHTPNLSGQRVTRWNKKNKKKKQAPSACLHPRSVSCEVGWHLEGGTTSSRDPGPEMGGSESGPVRMSQASCAELALSTPWMVSWMVSVSTTMVKISYFLSVRSGVAKAVGNVAVSLWCGLINILHGNCSIIYTTVPLWWVLGTFLQR